MTARLPIALLSGLLLCAACDDSEPNTADVDATSDTAIDTRPAGPDPILYGGDLTLVFSYINPEETGEVPLYTSPSVGVSEQRLSDLGEPITEGIDCRAGGCSLTADGAWLLYQSEGSLRVGEIGADGRITAADLQLLASDVDSVQVAGTRVVFTKAGAISYYDLAGAGVPQRLGEVDVVREDGIEVRGGGVALPAEGDGLILYRYDLSSMAIYRLSLTGEETFLYRLGMPRGTGSYFDGVNPVVTTDGGATVVALIEGLQLQDTFCQENDDCDALGPGATCHYYSNDGGVRSPQGLCGVPQITLQRFALEPSDLGARCSTDADCDPRHRCVIEPASLLLDPPERHCAPRALSLGPDTATGCFDRAEDEYAAIPPKLRATASGDVVFLGVNDCNEYNISDNAVVAVSAELDPATRRVIAGDFDAFFDQGTCFDSASQSFDFDACVIEIDDFEIGPEGDGLFLIGSAANDQQGKEIWAFDEEGVKFPVTSDIFHDVGLLYVIP